METFDSDKIIVVDWGTSNFRAFLVNVEDGAVIDERSSDAGLLSLSTAEFSDYCAKALQGWRTVPTQTPVYLAGMVGSARGWAESPQPDLPVNLDALAKLVVPAPGLENGWILPGVKIVEDSGNGLVDVMRGEEIQIFGALSLSSSDSAIDCCLPGTHSKWARVESGHLTRFVTAMTGEIYNTVLHHTLIGQPAIADAEFNEEAFLLGVKRVGQNDGGVLHALFEGRSRYLYAGLEASCISSYISGVLIGEEVQRMHAVFPNIHTLRLIGSQSLLKPYVAALSCFGISSDYVSAKEATIAGVLALARHHKR